MKNRQRTGSRHEAWDQQIRSFAISPAYTYRRAGKHKSRSRAFHLRSMPETHYIRETREPTQMSAKPRSCVGRGPPSITVPSNCYIELVKRSDEAIIVNRWRRQKVKPQTGLFIYFSMDLKTSTSPRPPVDVSCRLYLVEVLHAFPVRPLRVGVNVHLHHTSLVEIYTYMQENAFVRQFCEARAPLADCSDRATRGSLRVL